MKISYEFMPFFNMVNYFKLTITQKRSPLKVTTVDISYYLRNQGYTSGENSKKKTNKTKLELGLQT